MHLGGFVGGIGLPIFAQVPPARGVTIAPQVEMQFRWIKPGRFRMGSAPNETKRDADEGPQSEVEITRGFYLGTYEVTQQQWQAVMGDNPAAFQQGDDPQSRPVESVSWNDCAEFVQRLRELWESANFDCRPKPNGNTRAERARPSPFYWGEVNEAWEAYPHAWTNSRSFATTHAVGTKPPNPWGLHDMSGNVWEWCQDWYAPYPDSDRVDPTGPKTGTAKVFRGGSYYDFPHSLRSANRHRHHPDERYTAIGLRVVWEPASDEQPQAITLPLPGGLPLATREDPNRYFHNGQSAKRSWASVGRRSASRREH